MNKKEKTDFIRKYNESGESTRLADSDSIADVEQIQTPREGGFLTFLKGHLHPIKGWISRDEMEQLNKSKKYVTVLLKIARRFVKKQDPKELCPVGREIYRAMTVCMEREHTDNMKKKWELVRDFACWMSKDLSYRYRGQDLSTVIDIEKLKPDEGDKDWMARRVKKRKYNYGGQDAQWNNWDEKVGDNRKKI